MSKILVILLFVLLLFSSACTGVFFYPSREHVLQPDQLNLRYEDVYWESLDGVRLHGWFLPAKENSLGTILFLHGNAENISTHIGSVYWLPEQGFNVFLLDYRGYGASEGTPNLAALHKDVELVLEKILSRTEKVILFGQSLGGSIAIHVAAHSPLRKKISAVVVDSAFSDYRLIVREKLDQYLLTMMFSRPFSWTISDQFNVIEAVKELEPIPLLLIHGDSDTIVPVDHAYRLYKQAAEPKELWIVPQGKHIEAFRFPQYRRSLVRFLSEACGAVAENTGSVQKN